MAKIKERKREADVACFHEFAVSDWKVFFGNVLMFITCAFYLAWWAVAFWPKGGGNNSLAAFLITGAILAGIAAIVALSLGIVSLPRVTKGVPVALIPLAAIALYIVSLFVTKTLFHRPMTSEILVMFVWFAVECAAIVALNLSGRFGTGQTVLLSVLVFLATFVGLVCYVLYYRLDGFPSFWDGFIPLAVDAVVVAVFLSVQATS